jgi:hypothetical protein
MDGEMMDSWKTDPLDEEPGTDSDDWIDNFIQWLIQMVGG